MHVMSTLDNVLEFGVVDQHCLLLVNLCSSTLQMPAIGFVDAGKGG